jgi:hypothetical protein
MVAKRSARGERTQMINQARALVVTGPDDIRARFTTHTTAGLVADLAALRSRPGDVVGYSTRIALRELGRRGEFLGDQIDRLDELIVPLVAARAPGLLALFGVGPHSAAILLIAAGDHPQRLHSEAAWAHLCAVAPIPASSGKTNRHRLNPAVTAKPTMPCGGSCSPAWAPIPRLAEPTHLIKHPSWAEDVLIMVDPCRRMERRATFRTVGLVKPCCGVYAHASGNVHRRVVGRHEGRGKGARRQTAWR